MYPTVDTIFGMRTDQFWYLKQLCKVLGLRDTYTEEDLLHPCDYGQYFWALEAKGKILELGISFNKYSRWLSS